MEPNKGKRYAIVSCSLNPNSRSDILAKAAHEFLERAGENVIFIDLASFPLPACDGGACYGNAGAIEVKRMLSESHGIVLACPVYNYDVNSAAKNLVELTGRDVWTGKVAGFLLAAGGKGSYMAVTGLANSLLLDFHTIILPHFVYVTGKDFQDYRIVNPDVNERLEQMLGELVRFTNSLV